MRVYHHAQNLFYICQHCTIKNIKILLGTINKKFNFLKLLSNNHLLLLIRANLFMKVSFICLLTAQNTMLCSIFIMRKYS